MILASMTSYRMVHESLRDVFLYGLLVIFAFFFCKSEPFIVDHAWSFLKA